MKLLIVTQKVDENDDVLGFFLDWIKEFARHCEQIEVICLYEGEHHLPANVRVYSLGKEKGLSKFSQLLRLARYSLRVTRYDYVFVHMNPVYVVLAGWWWRLTGKKLVLWYTHRQVDLKLKIAQKLANVIATAAPESFKLVSDKVRVLGHGIDANKFLRSDLKGAQGPTSGLMILCVGRITPIKHQDVLIEALKILRKTKVNTKIKFVGTPVYESDVQYHLALKKKIGEYGLEQYIKFAGSIPNKDVAKEYWQAAVSVNLVPTGGLDKAVLESLAAGTPVLTSNRAFEPLGLPGLVVCHLHAEEVANKLATMLANPPAVDSERIAKEYSIEIIVGKILELYK